MEKSKVYHRTFFSADVLREGITVFEQVAEDAGSKVEEYLNIYSVKLSDESWDHDNLAEFLSDYRNSTGAFLVQNLYAIENDEKERFKISLSVFDRGRKSEVSVLAPTREQIGKIFEVFEKHVVNSQLVEEEEEKITPTIFIGHGHSNQWKDLKDHLHEQHGHQVQAYETAARAGHTIRDIIQEMISKSAFALLVFTRDDIIDEVSYRARQNVVHETGLFQGCLGFSRAIVLLEEGVEDFSNIDGIHQIRFSEGNIKETFGEVLATIRREFYMEN